VLEKRQRVRFDAKAALSTSTLNGLTRDQRGVTLQVNGSVVMLLSGVAAGRLSAVAEEAWRDLEIEPETAALRFDSASHKRQRNQLSLSSR
jgi:hypothetical protein